MRTPRAIPNTDRARPGFQVARRDSLDEWLRDALRKLPELDTRRMFGGTGIYSGGTMFGILHGGRVYLKTDTVTRAAFVARGSEPFAPPKGSVLKTYLEVPAEVLDDELALLRWARRALEVAEATAQKSRAREDVGPEQILSGHPTPIQRLAERLQKLVREAAPGANETGYPGWRLIGYHCPHYFCFVAPHPDHVRLGFEHGDRLADPYGVLESMGKQVKFVRLVPGKRIPSAAIRGLIQAALVILPEHRAVSSLGRRTARP